MGLTTPPLVASYNYDRQVVGDECLHSRRRLKNVVPGSVGQQGRDNSQERQRNLPSLSMQTSKRNTIIQH